MSKRNLTEMIADLRTDLKDSGALWSNPELTRCVYRAVADLSRYLPQQKFYELTFSFAVTDDYWTSPAAANATKIVSLTGIASKAAGDTATLVARTSAAYILDVPRPVAIAIADPDFSITSFTIIVKGTDENGNYLEESFYFSGGLSQTGKKYFKTVTEVEFDEITGNATADTLSVGTATHIGVWIQLNSSNKPIRPESDKNVDIGSGSAYTRDTDFEMDYQNGRIRLIIGTTMSAATLYYIDYGKCKVSVDLSAIIPDYIGYSRVRYPATDVPMSYVSADLFGDILVITGSGDESQSYLSENYHIVIEYLAPHTPPSQDAPGSYKHFLEETIMLASSGYALIMEAREHEHQIATDIASMRTELGLTTAVHALADAALDKVSTYVTDMDTALDAAIVQAAAAATALAKINDDGGKAYLTDADGALDNAATALAKIATYLEDNTSEDSKAWLTKITTDIAGLRTAVLAAVDAANTYLDEVDTTDLGQATVGAEGLLEAGDGLINAVNVGARVAENYAAYSAQRQGIASVRTGAAMGYIQEASQRLANLRTYLEQAAGWGAVAGGFAAEASQRIAEAGTRLGVADRYLVEARERTIAANAYISEANGRYNMCRAFIEEASARIAEIDRLINEANQYANASTVLLGLSDRYRAEGMLALEEARRVWHDPKQYIGDFSFTSTRQVGK